MDIDDRGTSRPGPDEPRVPDALLTGSLPCVTCGYELKGMTVRGVCPECGTAIRATILYAVDPLADEFAPLRFPRATGVLIVLWSIAGALGIWAVLGMRLAEGLQVMGMGDGPPELAWDAILGLLVVCGIGVLGFIAPLKSTPLRQLLCGVGALLAYVPFFYAMAQIRAIDAASAQLAYFGADLDPQRVLWRAVVCVCLLMVFLGIRPSARALVKRSLALRMRRVDRQTLAAMAGATVLAMLGDGVRLLGRSAGPGLDHLFDLTGSLVILIATLFLAFGMTSASVDSIRIAKAIRLGPKRLRDLVGGDPDAG